MDRALKERIIGAAVLVAIAVLVVPVFLDGGPTTPDNRMISEPVILPGQSREPGERRTVVLDRDRDEPLPDGPARDPARGTPTAMASTGPAATGPEPASDAAPDTAKVATDTEPAPAKASGEAASGEATVAQRTAPAPEKAPAKAEPPPPRREEPPAADPEPEQSATGMWAVQLGSFSNKANADRLAASLREDGYAAFLSRHTTASGELHRVRIGPQKDRASAEAVAAKLSAAGLKGQVVPHP